MEPKKMCWLKFSLVGLLAFVALFFVNACGVDDGLGKAGQTEEEFFTVIEAPLDLTVMSTETDSVTLAWLDMSSDEEGFAVFRREDAVADFTPIAVVVADTTSFIDTTVSDNTTYHYYLRALRGPFISDATEVATGTTPLIPATPPAAPSAVVANTLSDTSIGVSWTNVADETGFVIEYSDETNAPGVWTPISVAADITSLIVGSLTDTTEYAFRVKAVNDVGDSAYTMNPLPNPITNSAPPPLPAAPSGLTAQTVPYQDVVLTWLDNSSVEEEFIIRRNGAEIDRVSLDSTTYTDFNIVAGTYNYSVSAVNTTGESGPATVTGVVMPSSPAAPTNLSITYQLTSYRLNWTDNATNEELFKVWAYPVACIDVTRLIRPTLVADNLAPNTTSYTLYSTKNPPPSSAVCVYVQAVNDGGIGTSAKLSYTVK